MSRYLIRRDGQERVGPYGTDVLYAWRTADQLPEGTQCSEDGVTWMALADVPELGGSGAIQDAAPEIALYIRQGLSVQGPYAFQRIRGYVAQRRIQPYMMFSPDGLWWCAAEHVPGLLPEGYVPLPPPARPTVVPTAEAPPSAPAPVASAMPSPGGTVGPARGRLVRDAGSITLTGIQLSEQDLAPPVLPRRSPLPAGSPRAPRAPAGTAGEGAEGWYLRQDGRHLYGPFAAEVLREWIAEGRIGPDIELSLDGASWVLGARMPAFFPSGSNRIPGSRLRDAAAAAPTPVKRARRAP